MSIDNQGNITTKTFQKAMNLFLYIPRASAHPSNMTKSLIYGLLYTYQQQNTYHSDFLKNAAKLYHRLRARGHQASALNELFREAADKLEFQHHKPTYTQKSRDITEKQDNRIFFHIPYHPRDISRIRLRQIYKETLETTTPTTCNIRTYNNTDTKQPMGIKNLTIAYSRGKNLFDILCSSTLKEYDITATEILQQLRA